MGRWTLFIVGSAGEPPDRQEVKAGPSWVLSWAVACTGHQGEWLGQTQEARNRSPSLSGLG